MWTIWTDRRNEGVRRGIGDEMFERTVDHLRARGTRHVRIAWTLDGAIVEVDLGTRKNPKNPGQGRVA